MTLSKPVWHKTCENIDFSLQGDKILDKYIDSEFHIYKSSWAELRLVLFGSYPRLYSSKALYTPHQERFKIKRILNHWELNQALIPPMLILENNKLLPADGKHRLKVASLADPQEIYFILFDIDFPSILNFFNPQLVD